MVLQFLRGLFGSKAGRHPPGGRIREYPEELPPYALPDYGEDAFEAILEHVQRHIGPTHEVLHERISNTVHIDILPVPPSEAQPFWTFVTSGMSDRPMSAPKGAEAWRHGELLIRLPADWPVPEPGDQAMSAWRDPRAYWPIRILEMLAPFPHLYRSWIWTGHTLELGPPEDMAPGSSFTTVLLMPPRTLPEDFRTLQVSPDRTIHFLSVIPLCREEADFKIGRGLDALLDLFPDDPAEVEIIHVDRPNFAAGLSPLPPED